MNNGMAIAIAAIITSIFLIILQATRVQMSKNVKNTLAIFYSIVIVALGIKIMGNIFEYFIVFILLLIYGIAYHYLTNKRKEK